MNSSFSLILLVLFVPLLGSLTQALFGKKITDTLGQAAGKRFLGWLAVLPIAISFGVAVYLTVLLANLPPEARLIRLTFCDWITIQSINIPFEIQFDTLSATMVLIITGVGALIHLYATGYMSEEKEYARFFTYMNLFIAFMLMLVLGGNLALMFIGWEGVGLCSYLLIGFWYKDIANAKAANKAFIVNRIGDWGFALGVFLIVAALAGRGIVSHRLLSYDVIEGNGLALQSYGGLVTAIALLLFVGACGKSAQFPLYLWLPDAMAGPTPVSALIHAATMVTSGVFMLNRLNIFFQISHFASGIVAAVGAFTALFAAVIAFGQTDIKKVLAYSTVSQLGYMFLGCGAGAYWTGMFHVTTHAFFKALLFLGAGAVIHSMAHNQDMRNYGGLRKYLPITCSTMFVAYLAISGVPLFSGAFSKESLINAALTTEHGILYPVINGRMKEIDLPAFAGTLALFVAMLTAFYMTRMTWLTFFGKDERWRQIPAHAQEHADHAAHADPGHHESHEDHGHHGEDVHGFFFTDEEMAARQEEHEHHHTLDESHTPHEVPPSMWIPLVILAILSAGAGWYLDQNDRFKDWLYPKGLSLLGENTFRPSDNLFLFHMTLQQMSMLAAFSGILCGLLIYWRGLPRKEGWDIRKWSRFRLWAQNQFNYDSAMVGAAVQGGSDVGNFLWKEVDAGAIDGTVNGIGKIAMFFGGLFRKVQTGFVRSYALMMLAGGLLLLGYAAIRLMGGGQ